MTLNRHAIPCIDRNWTDSVSYHHLKILNQPCMVFTMCSVQGSRTTRDQLFCTPWFLMVIQPSICSENLFYVEVCNVNNSNTLESFTISSIDEIQIPSIKFISLH